MKYNNLIITDDYSILNKFLPGDVDEEVIFEFNLVFDQFKQQNERSSQDFFGLLEGLGGFYASLDMLVFAIANYFSARFFIMSFASSFYLLKNAKY